MNLTIEKISAATGGELILPASVKPEKYSGSHASGVFIDSRLCGENSVFVAIKGERSDGHSYIKDVFAKGALCAICEHLPDDFDPSCGPCVVVDSSTEALKKLAAYYRSTLDIKIVGIVGSMGKTSTKEMVASVLSQHYNTHKTSGNFNNEIGVPLTLLAIREEHEAAVVEMGISDFGEMDRLGAIVRPDAVVMTNIGPCHLEFLHDLDGVLKAKSEVFKYVAKNGLIALNGADEKLRSISHVENCRICYYNTDPSESSVSASSANSFGSDASGAVKQAAAGHPAEMSSSDPQDIIEQSNPGHPASQATTGNLVNFSTITVTNKKSLGLLGTSFKLVTPAGTIDATVHLPGAHTVTNAQAGAAIGLEFGLSLEEIAAGIGAVKPVQGRGYIEQIGGCTVIDDCYNANPESVKAAIDLLKTAEGRKCAILGDMFELGENSSALHAEVGEYAASAGLGLAVFIGAMSKNGYDAYNAHSSINSKPEKNHAARSAVKPEPVLPKAMYFKDLDTFFDFYSTIPFKKGDNILIKASHGMHFDKILAFFKENAIL